MKKSTKAMLIAATLTGAVAFTGCETEEEVIDNITQQTAYGIIAGTIVEEENNSTSTFSITEIPLPDITIPNTTV